MDKDILQVALSESAGSDVVVDVHLLLALKEEVVDELLLPAAISVSLEHSYAGVDEIEVKHGNMRPGAKGGRELESCFKRKEKTSASSLRMVEYLDSE